MPRLTECAKCGQRLDTEMLNNVDGYAVPILAHGFTVTTLQLQCVLLLHFGLFHFTELVFVASGKVFAHHLSTDADGNVTVVQRAVWMTQP